MNLARHCELCDNQEKSLKTGTTCGLTQRKPEFNRTCSKIYLNDKFKNKLKKINVEYEKVKRSKTITYTYFIVFLSISLAVIIGGFLFGKYVLDNGVISTVPIIIMGVGLGPLGLAFGALNKYRIDIEIAKSKKEKIDEILSLYSITYNFNVKFGNEYHGIQESFVDLQIKN